jgi:hypothetical protein
MKYIGKHNKNKEIIFDELVADEPGQYVLILYFQGFSLPISYEAEIGDTLKIEDTSQINENYTYEMEVQKPSGDLFVIDGNYNFVFETFGEIKL